MTKRITKAIREEIAEKVANNKHKKRLDTLYNQLQTLAVKVHKKRCEVATGIKYEELEAQCNAVKKAWLDLPYGARGWGELLAYRDNIKTLSNEWVSLPEKLLTVDGCGKRTADALEKKLDEVKKAYDKEETALETTKEDAYNALLSFTTVKKLMAEWPEMAKFAPQEALVDNSTLPAVQIKKLTEELGLA